MWRRTLLLSRREAPPWPQGAERQVAWSSAANAVRPAASASAGQRGTSAVVRVSAALVWMESCVARKLAKATTDSALPNSARCSQLGALLPTRRAPTNSARFFRAVFAVCTPRSLVCWDTFKNTFQFLGE